MLESPEEPSSKILKSNGDHPNSSTSSHNKNSSSHSRHNGASSHSRHNGASEAKAPHVLQNNLDDDSSSPWQEQRYCTDNTTTAAANKVADDSCQNFDTFDNPKDSHGDNGNAGIATSKATSFRRLKQSFQKWKIISWDIIWLK